MLLSQVKQHEIICVNYLPEVRLKRPPECCADYIEGYVALYPINDASFGHYIYLKGNQEVQLC